MYATRKILAFCSRDLCAISTTLPEGWSYPSVNLSSAYTCDLVRLINFCESIDDELIISNISIGAEPIFITRPSHIILDLTLATNNATDFVMGWHVWEEATC